MPIPSTVSNRITAAIAAVSESTDLDLLISLIDVGQRSGVNISVASAELLRRANLVDANTDSITASKIAAGLFKIDYPVADLWTGSNGGGGSGIEVGQYVPGHLTMNDKFVPANGARYKASLYPDMNAIISSKQINSFHDATNQRIDVLHGSLDASTQREPAMLIDGDFIIVGQQPVSNGTGFLFGISTDGGATWRQSFPKAAISATTTPELTNNGITNTLPMVVGDFVKLDSPGHYAAVVITNHNTTSHTVLMYTEDYGLTWKGFYRANVSALNIGVNTAVRLWYRNGVYLTIIGGTSARYSVDQGKTWITMTDASFTSTSLANYGYLSDDGWLSYASGTSAVYLQWPASAAGWSAALQMNTSTSRFATAMEFLKKFGNMWFAYSSSTSNSFMNRGNPNDAYTSNSLATLMPGLQVVRDADFYNGNVYLQVFINTGAIGDALMYFPVPAGSTIASLTEITNTATPPTRNAITLLRYPLRTRFGRTAGSKNGVYFRHGREAIAQIVAPTGSNNILAKYGFYPTQYPQFCYKYGIWFGNVRMMSGYHTTSTSNLLENNIQWIHCYSQDQGATWKPIGLGYGGIYDTGTRLLRVNADGQVQQSTDGLTWNITGITQPTALGSTLEAARIWGVNGATYLYRANTTQSASTLHVTKDNGATWTAITSISSVNQFARIKSNVGYYKEMWYAITAYYGATPTNNGDSKVDTFTVYRSADGVVFTQIYTAAISTGTYSSAKAGIRYQPDGNSICFSHGGGSGATPSYYTSSADGLTILNGQVQGIVNIFISSIADCVYANGQHYTCDDIAVSINSQAVRVQTWSLFGVPVLQIVNHNSLSVEWLHGLYPGEANMYMVAKQAGPADITPDTLSFWVPPPNQGTGAIPYPHLKVKA